VGKLSSDICFEGAGTGFLKYNCGDIFFEPSAYSQSVAVYGLLQTFRKGFPSPPGGNWNKFYAEKIPGGDGVRFLALRKEREARRQACIW
jgi:hypothetical protein